MGLNLKKLLYQPVLYSNKRIVHSKVQGRPTSLWHLLLNEKTNRVNYNHIAKDEALNYYCLEATEFKNDYY